MTTVGVVAFLLGFFVTLWLLWAWRDYRRLIRMRDQERHEWNEDDL